MGWNQMKPFPFLPSHLLVSAPNPTRCIPLPNCCKGFRKSRCESPPPFSTAATRNHEIDSTYFTNFFSYFLTTPTYYVVFFQLWPARRADNRDIRRPLYLILEPVLPRTPLSSLLAARAREGGKIGSALNKLKREHF